MKESGHAMSEVSRVDAHAQPKRDPHRAMRRLQRDLPRLRRARGNLSAGESVGRADATSPASALRSAARVGVAQLSPAAAPQHIWAALLLVLSAPQTSTVVAFGGLSRVAARGMPGATNGA